MSDDEIDRLFPSDPLPDQASRTIRTRAELREEVARVRRQGFATNLDEFLDGVSGAAVPVTVGSRTVASLSLAGPTGRVHPEDWIDDLRALTTMPDPAALSGATIENDPSAEQAQEVLS